ncbi:bifunctional helix-turn-helix transcriptional regulator/GNAT family N-acetyltransferase [Nisaea sediminum]|uniref:bifunctional helix-turn-helix transcriptional regulator/GNAT family N-acetyltransferase n=1 Tax=Nisaea sediminum TaxID=2775867 RepID=UPI001D026EE4|nr:bifunctional helix-turn-helix transcriptional regulator/GNAT family N-acetyltransferase [Nisaea sediminum]
MPDATDDLLPQIDAVRAFNRFYTRQIGLLNEGLLKSDYSLSEMRVIYELAHRDEVTATELARDLGLDNGYLSRMLKKFEKRGLIRRRPSDNDARQSILSMTDEGHTVFRPFEQASRDEIRALIEPLPTSERTALLKSMTRIQATLGGLSPTDAPFILRDPRPGDMGQVIRRQAEIYSQEYGWDITFEALVARIAADFIEKYDPAKERCWIAERNGEVVGSVFVVRQDEEVAKLRMLFVEASARGLGIGRKLVEECILFARAKGYRTLTLWTNDILVSARRIYQAAGFKLVEEERHHSFGKDLVGQNWDLKL